MKLLKELLGFSLYVSEIDLFLQKLDDRFELSASQRQEKAKHNTVFAKRDYTIIKQPNKKYWDNF